MNKKGSLFKIYMIRPVLYKCVTRAALAVTALLLWGRFINTAGRLSLLRDGCLTAGLLFFCMAWFSYLHLDGVTILVDFADEHIVSFDELSGEERAVCSMSANLICGALFMLPWLVKFLGDFL